MGSVAGSALSLNKFVNSHWTWGNPDRKVGIIRALKCSCGEQFSMRSLCENGQASDSVIALSCNFGEEDDITSSSSLREKGSKLIRFILGRGAWYLLLMPIWMIIADYGQRNLLDFAESEAMRTPLPHKPLKKEKKTHRRTLSDIAILQWGCIHQISCR
jgi:hypothetical protein